MLAHTLKSILPFVKRALQPLTDNAPARQICAHMTALSSDRTDLSAFSTKDGPRIPEGVAFDDLTGS
jgi:hypothetical protein